MRGFKAGWVQAYLSFNLRSLNLFLNVWPLLCKISSPTASTTAAASTALYTKGHKSERLRGAVRPGVCVLCEDVDTVLMESHLIVRKHGCNSGARRQSMGRCLLASSNNFRWMYDVLLDRHSWNKNTCQAFSIRKISASIRIKTTGCSINHLFIFL